MKNNICFIVSEPLKNLVDQLLPEISSSCQARVRICLDNESVIQIYLEEYDWSDAFVFGGRASQFIIIKNKDLPQKPCFAFYDHMTNLNDVFLKLLLKNRNMDFSRVLVDHAYTDNNYLGLKELLPSDQWPYFADDLIEISDTSDRNSMEELLELLYQRHLALHSQGLIDLSITRFGQFVKIFNEKRIPYIYLTPDKDKVITFILQIIDTLSQKSSNKQCVSSIVIQFMDKNIENYEEKISRVGRGISEYAVSRDMDMTYTRSGDRIQIITYLSELEQMTNHFTDRSFSGEMGARAEYKIRIGLGAGHSIFQAQINAVNAMEVSRSANDGIYFVDENNKVRGPLGYNRKAYDRNPNDQILSLSRKFGLDHRLLQRIISYSRVSHISSVTAAELASYLNLSVRSAHRILVKLKEGNGAVVYRENASGGRGRPKDHYKLTFLNDLYK